MKQGDLWNPTPETQPTITESQTRKQKIHITNAVPSHDIIHPTTAQVEKLRLILSTYQDGFGQEGGGKLPGWRDFERATATVFNGQATESKHIFDVIVTPKDSKDAYGISCKMRGELNKSVDRTDKEGQALKGRIYMELSNASKYFWRKLKNIGINDNNYRSNPEKTGIALVDLVKSWHDDVSIEKGGNINLNQSFYLVLLWDKKGEYQLYQFTVNLPDPRSLKWHFPTKQGKGGVKSESVRLAGNDEFGPVFEWYGDTGGQLKYYPLVQNAIWTSKSFRLEPLPTLNNFEHRLSDKAKKYFPNQWEAASEDNKLI